MLDLSGRNPMISFERYGVLLRAPALRYSFAASLLGRLPIGITGLAILLLVQSSSGSFAQGGAATACYLAGLALIAPAWGRSIDRAGPRRALLACGVIFPLALGALVIANERGSAAAVLACAAVAGGAFPPITVCMRTFLKQQLSDEQQLAAAYSLESVLIELVFIAGPMLVAFFVAWASAAAAVLFSAACGALGTALFVQSPALGTWRIEPQRERALLGPLADRGFLALIGVVLCYSAAFGFLEIGITAYATESGSAALAGVLLGITSVGSALGGLAYGSRSWHAPLAKQFAAMLALMGAGLGLLAVGWPPLVFALCCALAGIVMAPALIIQSMLVARTARLEHSTEAFTWSSSALLSGVGIGLAAGGGLLEVQRSGAALGAGAACALLAAIGARFSLRR
jgi:predicted MFS family arabinose efflux permease